MGEAALLRPRTPGKSIHTVEGKPSPVKELDIALRELKEAESSVLAADTWLKQVADRIARGDFSSDDAEYLRGLLGSERFEEGSVQFLSSVVQSLEEGLALMTDPERKDAAQLRLTAAKKHLEALGKRLAGLRLLLKGPKPLQSTPPQA